MTLRIEEGLSVSNTQSTENNSETPVITEAAKIAHGVLQSVPAGLSTAAIQGVATLAESTSLDCIPPHIPHATLSSSSRQSSNGNTPAVAIEQSCAEITSFLYSHYPPEHFVQSFGLNLLELIEQRGKTVGPVEVAILSQKLTVFVSTLKTRQPAGSECDDDPLLSELNSFAFDELVSPLRAAKELPPRVGIVPNMDFTIDEVATASLPQTILTNLPLALAHHYKIFFDAFMSKFRLQVSENVSLPIEFRQEKYKQTCSALRAMLKSVRATDMVTAKMQAAKLLSPVILDEAEYPDLHAKLLALPTKERLLEVAPCSDENREQMEQEVVRFEKEVDDLLNSCLGYFIVNFDNYSNVFKKLVAYYKSTHASNRAIVKQHFDQLAVFCNTYVASAYDSASQKCEQEYEDDLLWEKSWLSRCAGYDPRKILHG